MPDKTLDAIKIQSDAKLFDSKASDVIVGLPQDVKDLRGSDFLKTAINKYPEEARAAMQSIQSMPTEVSKESVAFIKETLGDKGARKTYVGTHDKTPHKHDLDSSVAATIAVKAREFVQLRSEVDKDPAAASEVAKDGGIDRAIAPIREELERLGIKADGGAHLEAPSTVNRGPRKR